MTTGTGLSGDREQQGGAVLLVAADAVRIREEATAGPPHPRVDFLELAAALEAEVVSYSETARSNNCLVQLIFRRFSRPLALALHGFFGHRRARLFFTGAENIGLPLALLLKLFRAPAAQVMIGHLLSEPKKRPFYLLRPFSRVHGLICYSTVQTDYARKRLGLEAERVNRIDFQVDASFFDDGGTAPAGPVLSVGRELRDYPTWFEALEGTDLRALVIASSPWSRREDQTAGRTIPENVQLKKGLTYEELRACYRAAPLVVVPLQDVASPAGITSILEAMACSRPVVVSDTPGIREVIRPGVTGELVPCGDAGALRRTVQDLLAEPERLARMGRAARDWVLEGRTIEHFVERISAVAERALAWKRGERTWRES